jgi:hypothetical protein
MNGHHLRRSLIASPMEDIDRNKPVIQACLANAERLINAAKDVHKPGPLPWQACNVPCSR